MTTRSERIAMFFRLLRELPAGPDRDAEIERRSGITELDFKAMIKADELADQQADAMMEQHEAERSAWRREIITCLTHWDDMTVADQRACIIRMRDFFQRLADAEEHRFLPQIDPVPGGT